MKCPAERFGEQFRGTHLVVGSGDDPRILIVELNRADIVQVPEEGEETAPQLVVPHLQYRELKRVFAMAVGTVVEMTVKMVVAMVAIMVVVMVPTMGVSGAYVKKSPMQRRGVTPPYLRARWFASPRNHHACSYHLLRAPPLRSQACR